MDRCKWKGENCSFPIEQVRFPSSKLQHRLTHSTLSIKLTPVAENVFITYKLLEPLQTKIFCCSHPFCMPLDGMAMLPVQAWPERFPGVIGCIHSRGTCRNQCSHISAADAAIMLQIHEALAKVNIYLCKTGFVPEQAFTIEEDETFDLISAGNEMVVAAHGGKCSGDLTATAQNQSFGLVGRRNPFLHCRRHTEIRYRVLRRTLKCSAGLCGMPNLVGFTHQTHNAPQFTKVIPKGIITLHFLPLATARS